MDGAGEFNGGRRGWVQHRQAREFGGRTPLYVTRRPRPRCRRGSGPGTATMARRFGCGIYNMAQAWGSDARYLETAVGWQTARQGREAYEGNGPSAPESCSEGFVGPCCRWAGGNATQEYLQADMAIMVIGFGAASAGQSPRSAGPWPWRSALGRRCCVNNPRGCHDTGGRGLAMGKWAWEGRRLVRRMSIPSR